MTPADFAKTISCGERRQCDESLSGRVWFSFFWRPRCRPQHKRQPRASRRRRCHRPSLPPGSLRSTARTTCPRHQRRRTWSASGYGPSWSVQFVRREARYLGINQPDQYFTGAFYWVANEKAWDWHAEDGKTPPAWHLRLVGQHSAGCLQGPRAQAYLSLLSASQFADGRHCERLLPQAASGRSTHRQARLSAQREHAQRPARARSTRNPQPALSCGFGR